MNWIIWILCGRKGEPPTKRLLEWGWLDSKFGLGPGWGLTLLISGSAVLGQWILILLQIFCRPCIRTMFETLNL